MNNKTSLALLEQLAMTMIFAFSAAICLSAFGKSRQIRQETEIKQQAVVLAQSSARLLKAGGQVLPVENPDFRIKTVAKQCYIEGLTLADIEIYYKGRLVYTLETGWQEVGYEK